jgi:LmbE family N-acetylglucosaminyl deacetylase
MKNDVRELGTILGVWAHPDDESFMAGGILAMAARNGQKVACVTATKGEAGIRDEARWPPETLAQVRARELEAALEVLGVSEHEWLGYADGYCDLVPEHEAVERLAKLIEKYRPDSILTFGPEGMTGHPDHRAVSTWTAKAVAEGGSRARVYHCVCDRRLYERHLKEAGEKIGLFYNIDEPPLVSPDECAIYCRLTDEMLDQKCQALKKMPSQMEAAFKAAPDLGEALRVECFVKA